MPYIAPEDRVNYDDTIDHLVKLIEETGFSVGSINYIISSIIWKCWKKMGGNYTSGNNLVGVLECIKIEFYRRRLAGYEDKKITENGDVKD